MSFKDQRVDAYIAQSQPFAREILGHIRELIHKTCPDVEETIKWGFPHFDYNGGMMCSFASFKEHCAFVFWKASLMKDKKLTVKAKGKSAMGHLGRITSLDDLPSDKRFVAYIKEAMQLNDEWVRRKRTPAVKTKKELVVPPSFLTAIQKNKKAFVTFVNFSYSNKKEYVQWITEAKTDETRQNRLETAIEWMSQGKVRNWKYLKK